MKKSTLEKRRLEYEKRLEDLRAPIPSLIQKFFAGNKPRSWDYQFYPSPNKSLLIAAFNFYEYRMGATACVFHLYDRHGKLLNPYSGLSSENPKTCIWSKSGKKFCMRAHYGKDGLFVHDLKSDRFTAAGITRNGFFSLPAVIPRWEDENHLRVDYDEGAIRAANAAVTFGAGKAQWPKKRYKKPDSVRIDLSKFKWLPLKRLQDFDKLLKKNPRYEMEMIRDGYFDYHGPYPQSTKAMINTRQMEGFHLEAFAEYGDPQAQVWFKEFRKKCKVQAWAWQKVAAHIGVQKRTLPAP